VSEQAMDSRLALVLLQTNLAAVAEYANALIEKRKQSLTLPVLEADTASLRGEIKALRLIAKIRDDAERISKEPVK